MKPLSKTQLRRALVPRRPEDHKGAFGHVLLVAGSLRMAGAAILAARAALRSGAGLVTAAVPKGIQGIVAGQVPEALTIGLPENSSGALKPEGVGRLQSIHRETGFGVLAIGPGLSTHPQTAKFVVLALSSLDLPAVVDADALNILASLEPAGVRRLLRSRAQPCIFTPHPGEMARCLGISVKEVQKDRKAAAKKLAYAWNGTVLLKGHDTVIADASRLAVNPTGATGLAKGGTGDVLTGLIAGLWGQVLTFDVHSLRPQGDDRVFLTAALAAWLHGRAGELAEKALTPYAMTAQDVIENLPAAFKELL